MNDLTIAVFSFSGHQFFLPYCLKAIRSNAPEHKEIILVWDDSIDWEPIDFDCLRRDTGVDFRLVMHSDICVWPESIVRFGWVKQQLAKLHCYQYSNTDYTWIVDGDVLLTGDPELFSDHRPILRYNTGSSVPVDYRFFMERYLGILDVNSNSFVGSTGLFEHAICQDLQNLCMQRSGRDLVAAVDHMLTSDPHPALPFSEFEYYGHLARHQAHWIIKPHNYNAVWTSVHDDRADWTAPIQVFWSTPDLDLDFRYQNLMQHRHPEAVDQ